MRVPFTKMHGLGNDFVVIDLVSNHVEFDAEQVKRLADRHTGIGFDQLLLVEPPSDPGVDFDYRIFNVDGREVEHCGNGARCFATFVHDKGLTVHNPVKVKTMNRTLELALDRQGLVTVDMGPPELDPDAIPLRNASRTPTYHRQVQVDGRQMQLEFCAVSMGNPHAVIVVEDLDHTAVKEIGAALGAHPDFPEGVNVGFMEIIGADEIRLRVVERGVGETQACGTGACAAVVAGCLLQRLGDTVKVHLPGGDLKVSWHGGESAVMLTGPTATVFEGSVDL